MCLCVCGGGIGTWEYCPDVGKRKCGQYQWHAKTLPSSPSGYCAVSLNKQFFTRNKCRFTSFVRPMYTIRNFAACCWSDNNLICSHCTCGVMCWKICYKCKQATYQTHTHENLKLYERKWFFVVSEPYF